MKIRISNQLNMVGACINVAQSPDYVNVWTGQAPADFEADLGRIQTGYGDTSAKAALADGATGGAGDAKAAAETVLEEAAFVLARALVSHFKKIGDLDRLGKVDVTKTDIVKLRNQKLVAKTTEIRDLADVAQGEPNAADRGVTPARVSTLSAAITGFSTVMSLPRGQIVNRGTLLKEVETDTAGLMVQLTDLDDLAIQFDGTDVGRRFVEAWKRARMIVDSSASGATPPTPPTPPAPATPHP